MNAEFHLLPADASLNAIQLDRLALCLLLLTGLVALVLLAL